MTNLHISKIAATVCKQTMFAGILQVTYNYRLTLVDILYFHMMRHTYLKHTANVGMQRVLKLSNTLLRINKLANSTIDPNEQVHV